MEHAAWMGEEMAARALAAGFDEARYHHDLSERERYIVVQPSQPVGVNRQRERRARGITEQQ